MSSWATAAPDEDDGEEPVAASRGQAADSQAGSGERGQSPRRDDVAAAGPVAAPAGDGEEDEYDDGDMPSVDSVPLPDSLDRPTARLIQQMIWDEGSKIPPDIPDDKLPTFGEIRSRVEARMTTKIRKPWRKWMRETTTILLQRQAAGLPLR